MSATLIGVVAVIYLVAALGSVVEGDLYKAGLLLCWGLGNFFLIFLSDT